MKIGFVGHGADKCANHGDLSSLKKNALGDYNEGDTDLWFAKFPYDLKKGKI